MIKCCICSCVCDSKAVWSPGAERLRRQTKGPHDNGSKGVKQIYFDICHRSPRSAEPGGPCLKRQVARWKWLSISRCYLRRGRAGISESWPSAEDREFHKLLCEHERETRKNQQSPGPAKLLSAAAPKEPAKSAKATSREVAKEDPARPPTVDERKAARAKEAARTSEAKRLLSGLNFRWADGSRGLSSARQQFVLCTDSLCRAGGGQPPLSTGLAARAAVLSSCVGRPSGQ